MGDQASDQPRVGLERCHDSSLQVDIATPEVFIGGLLGAMLVFLFSAWACLAVGRSAQAVVNEVHLPGSPHSIAPESHAPNMQTPQEELVTCLMGLWYYWVHASMEAYDSSREGLGSV